MATSVGLLPDFSNALADAVDRAGKSAVTVDGRERLPSTGVVWRPGIIVTADHALERDEEITVSHPDLSGPVGTVLAGRDPTTDLAVLRADDLALPVAEGRELDSLKVGHIVLAVARTGNTGLSASLGVMSAIGGPWTTWRGGAIDHFVRADLDLYYGFSGGPLIDTLGRVIGVNTSGLSRRFDLTVPRSTVNRVIDQLLAKGRIARGYLGLGMQPVRIPDHIARGLRLDGNGGVIVMSVEPGQPADKGGVLIGDVLVSFDGNSISGPEDVLALLCPDKVGKDISARAVRAGSVVDLKITVGERPAHWE
jgi:S1-C subfamily serine protease